MNAQPTLENALPRLYAWFTAVHDNDTVLLEDLHAHGVPVDTLHPLRHSTALMEATRLGRATTVRWLLEQGAAPAFLCGQPSGTALHCALRRREWEIAAMLTAKMESCAVIDAYGATPLHTLASESFGEQVGPEARALASLFIAKHCPLDALDHDGTTALHHCVINDQLALAELLLMHGANPNARIPDSGVSPLTIAALEKNPEMAQLLIHHGANAFARTKEGTTPASLYPPLMMMVKATRAETVD